MDQKKKKIYYIAVAATLVVAAGIIFYSNGSVPEIETPPLPVQQANTNRTGANPSAKKTYTAPPVFPGDTKFDDSVFEASNFKILTPSTPNVVTPGDLGRENPFTSF